MSLYRAGLKLALFLPLGVALASRRCFRVHRCELRFRSALSDRRDCVTNRTRVQKLSAARTTCLVRSFAARPVHADAQAGTGPSAGFDDPASGQTGSRAHVYDLAVVLPTRPMCKAVQGPTGIKRLERNYRRSQLYAMQRIYEELPLGMPRSTSTPLSKPGRPRNRWVVSKRSEASMIPAGVRSSAFRDRVARGASRGRRGRPG